VANVAIDGVVQAAQPGELLIDLINRTGVSVPHVCYHPQLGPIQTCDTYMVEANGRLVRACATRVAEEMRISTKSAKASAAQAPKEHADAVLAAYEVLQQVLEPLEGCQPDWKIVQDVAKQLGAGWHYQHPSEIMDEIASLTPLFAGITYERLAGYKSLQWPVAADETDERLLYTKRFVFPDGKARLFPVSWIGPNDQPDSQFDLHLNNGRLLEHFHEGNLTYRTVGIREKTPDTFVEVSPELAEERGIQSGTWVQLVSRCGQLRVRALVTDEGIAQATAERDQPVSLLGLLRRAISKDSLRGLAAAIDFLQAFGRHLHSSESRTSQT